MEAAIIPLHCGMDAVGIGPSNLNMDYCVCIHGLIAVLNFTTVLDSVAAAATGYVKKLIVALSQSSGREHNMAAWLGLYSTGHGGLRMHHSSVCL